MNINKTIKHLIFLTIFSHLFVLKSFSADILINNNAFIQSIGGSTKDIFNDGVENSLGELLCVGYTTSSSISGSSSLGSDDGLLAKYNSNGNLSWIKRIGGSGRDRLTSVVLNSDDSILVAGKSKSTDAGFSNNGDYDAIISKISNSGDIIWTKNWGGSGEDSFLDIIKTSDGGYLAVGETDSTDLEFPTSGAFDLLAVKFDTAGNKQWSRTYGGTGDDTANSIIEVSDGYIVAGHSSSTDVGYTNKGYFDAFILKLNKAGDKEWIKGFGGGPYDSFRSITNTTDGFICVGETYSNTSEIQNNGPSGTRDAVLVKYNLNGDAEFIKTFGGTNGEVYTQVFEAHNGNYIAIGYSDSTDAGFVNKGEKDAILVQYDTSGNQLKLDSFGGNGNEEIDKGTYTHDGSLVFFGESSSTNMGYENKGDIDAVAFKYNISIEEALKAVLQAEQSRRPIDIELARNKVKVLPQSIHKTNLNNRIDAIIPLEDFFPSLELKTASANLDIYIKSENMLSLSLNTNNITFDDFSGVKDIEKPNAIILTVDSSLPYQINSYLASGFQNSDKSKTLDISILNIKANSESNYKEFIDTTNSITLLDYQINGNNLTHGIDLKLKGGLAHKADIYKAVIKFEVTQK